MSDESLDAMLDKYGYIGRIISHNAQYLKQAHSRGLPIDTVIIYSYIVLTLYRNFIIENI